LDTDQATVPGKTLIGGWANDTLIGTSGDDKIFGKAGSDLLTGGEGKDIFAFDTRLDGSRVDTITDFDVNDDTVQLDNAIFASLFQGGLGEANFRAGSRALDRNDYILYDRSSGIISYDPDGSGWQDAVAFAKVTPGLALAHDHFLVV
jgi:Ca2+-binding RTX toxin-like protein